jgi:hypothetical protein
VANLACLHVFQFPTKENLFEYIVDITLMFLSHNISYSLALAYQESYTNKSAIYMLGNIILVSDDVMKYHWR